MKNLRQKTLKNLEESKHKKKSKNKTIKSNNKKIQEEKTVCVLDYFYIMRQRLNYKDSSFLEGVSAKDAKEYCNYYYKFVNNFLTPFRERIKFELESN
jgi:hypothetical protein